MPLVMTEAEAMQAQAKGYAEQRALLPEDVRTIRTMAAAGTKQAVLARMFGVCSATIRNVVRRLHYKDIE